MPPTPNLSFTSLDEFLNKPVVENRKSDASIIEEYVSDSEEENVSQPKIEKKTVKPSIAKIESKDVNTARPKAVVNVVQGNNVNDVKGNPQIDLQDKGVIDSGCSRHMTGNMSYLTDYEEIDGGYVAFGGNPKRGKITGKDTIKTGSGPDWLFDIDALTRTMNYEPVVADPNGTKEFLYDGSNPSKCYEKKVDEVPRKESECNDQEKEDNVNSTNTVNAAGIKEVNVVGGKTSIKLPFDPNMPALEDYNIFDSSRDDEDDGAEADMNNLDTTIQVSPIPTTRIHKNHPLKQVIGDLQSATHTRKMSKNLKEHGLVSSIQQRTNHKDLHNCLFAYFLSQEEPKKVIHPLKDPSWIEAMQEEFLQFKLQEVWTLVDLPNEKKAIGTKWVFKNKKDERGIVIRNKARLVAQGYTQEEGIDYDEVFAPVARIEAIRLFLAYASFKGICGYQWIQKVLFSMGRLKKRFIEVQDYCKHTPMETQSLAQGEDGEEVDVHIARNNSVAKSKQKAEYVAAIKFADTYNMVAFLSKPTESDGFEQIVDFLNAQPIRYALTVNPTIYISCIEQLWSTGMVKTINGEVQFHALVDGKKIIIFEAFVRRDLKLEDEEGIDCLPNSTIFEQLALMGYEKISQKLTFYKPFFSPQWKFLIHTILQCLSSKTTAWKFNFSKYIFESMIRNLDNMSGKFLMYPRKPKRKDTQVPQPSGSSEHVADEVVHKELGDSLVRAATTASSLEAEQDSGNITKTRSKATPNESSSLGTTSGGGPRCQETIGDTIAQTRFENVSKHSNDSLLARGNTLQSDEDSLKLKELMELCTNLQQRVLDLEKTKTTQQNEIASLKRRVKKLEQKKRSRTHGLKRLHKVGMSRRVESFGDEDDLGEDASKQGRRINAIDAYEDITLVNVQDDADNEMFDVDAVGNTKSVGHFQSCNKS
ncbi:putative ribonuclease H-like domain-containing protein [Tanacetum coccineum]|uniref:Ribonuclease H-like domain-containing protein n=1 Tax=Tanacetum coccineum TaxID=301880 RepID=A0ABQ5FKD0_9ASTR